MATLEELTTPLTKDEIEAAIFAAIEARGVATSSWKPGAIARTIIAAVALILSAFSSLQATIANSGFLELSSGSWLEIVARQVYGVEKIVGTFASGNVTLDNAGAGVFSIAIGDLTVANSTSGKTYKNTATIDIAAFETGVIAPVQAVEIGSDSSSAATLIDTLVTVLSGVTVTNALSLVGTDPETDAALTTRALAKTGTLSPNGPSDAYRFLALSAKTDDGASAGVTRVTTTADGEGNVSVLLATASGTITGSLGDTTTPLGAANEEIQVNAVPLAVTATVASAVALAIAPTYELWVRSAIGLTETEIKAQVAAALLTFFSVQPIGGSRKVPGGGFVFTDAIDAAITEVIGTGNLIDLDLTVPAADAAVASNEAPVVGTITATVNLVAI